MAKGKKLFDGVAGGVPGTFTGKVRIVNGDPAKIAKVELGDILVGSYLSPEYDKYLEKAGAFIQNVGGPNNHVNTMSKSKWHKVSISGTNSISSVEATKELQEGQLLILEGFTGYITRTKADGTPYQIPIGSIYEWIPEKPVAPTMPAPAKPFDKEAYFKAHLKPKGG